MYFSDYEWTEKTIVGLNILKIVLYIDWNQNLKKMQLGLFKNINMLFNEQFSINAKQILPVFE